MLSLEQTRLVQRTTDGDAVALWHDIGDGKMHPNRARFGFVRPDRHPRRRTNALRLRITDPTSMQPERS